MSERLDEAWQLWVCADCDPAHDDIGEPSRYDAPYVLLLPEGVPAPEHCPRCGDYLPFCEGADGLRITNTPAERWAAQQREGGER